MTNPLLALSLGLIRAYQRHLSPRKGYGCALRLSRGRGSGCSGVALRLLRRYGLWHGWPLLRRRLQRCSQAAQAWQTRPRAPLAQRGDCDLGCVDVDVSGLKSACRPNSVPACSCAGDALSSCGGCGSGKGSSRAQRAMNLLETLAAIGLALLLLSAIGWGVYEYFFKA